MNLENLNENSQKNLILSRIYEACPRNLIRITSAVSQKVKIKGSRTSKGHKGRVNDFPSAHFVRRSNARILFACYVLDC